VARKPLRFTSLHTENWKNFSRVETELQQRVFLVGPNASGKSNFLDVFRFLQDLVIVGGGFQAASNKRGGIGAIRSLSARRPPEVAIRVGIGDDETPNIWQYELRFTRDARRDPVVKSEEVSRVGKPLMSRPNDQDQRDPAQLSQTYLEQVNVNKDFREVAEFFRSIKYLHIVPQLVREPERSFGRTNDPFGGDFIEQLARTPKRTREARLRKIVKVLKVAVPQLRELDLAVDERSVWHLEGRYDHWRPHAAIQREDQFSDGTLRLLGLLWAALDGTGPLLLEEPELSLHPGVVRQLPQVFARMQEQSLRQIIVSTHSSDLLRDTDIGLDEVLLLLPRGEGTVVTPANELSEVKHLLEGGLTLADAVLPQTKPKESDQLSLLLDE